MAKTAPKPSSAASRPARPVRPGKSTLSKPAKVGKGAAVVTSKKANATVAPKRTAEPARRVAGKAAAAVKQSKPATRAVAQAMAKAAAPVKGKAVVRPPAKGLRPLRPVMAESDGHRPAAAKSAAAPSPAAATKPPVLAKLAAAAKPLVAAAKPPVAAVPPPAKPAAVAPAAVTPPPAVAKPRRNPSGLGVRDLQHFADLLLAKRREIVGDMHSMEGEALRSGSNGLSNLPVHMADMGTDNYEQEFTLGLVEKDRHLLREINHALGKIPAGTFGICEGTGDAIGKPRLEVQPWARHSIEYARQRERNGRGVRMPM